MWLTKDINIIKSMHDVFGLKQSVFSILAIFSFSLLSSIWLLFIGWDFFSELTLWKTIIALVVILDINAGLIANFTKGTNDFYQNNPKNRWVFISIHIHILIVAWLFEIENYAAVIISWAATILVASMINMLKNSAWVSLHRIVAAMCLGLGLILIMSLNWSNLLLQIVVMLFYIKVAYSFSVNHYE
ncbi:MAG: hypothetical protein HRU38_13615 [Saccharospirillaceae bacterium]|nr:hypothetical protein [Pseudomonadales bacterium]NRB79682.1 hypothetical protein [Saccharospirillaceae bacterium]